MVVMVMGGFLRSRLPSSLRVTLSRVITRPFLPSHGKIILGRGILPPAHHQLVSPQLSVSGSSIVVFPVLAG